MTFSSMWPLAFLIAVPIIIILYLLKPKGEDKKISSNLLWQKIIKNNQSRTFFEKFTNNILMYLQILIALLLIFALMSPFIQTKGKDGGNTVIIVDTSGSMQHKTENGDTRIEEAVKNASQYVDSVDKGSFTVISCSDNAELLISNSKKKKKVKDVLVDIQADDVSGNLTEAYSLVETVISGQGEETDYSVYVFTDGDGIDETAMYTENMNAEVFCAGGVASNISLDYVSQTETEEGYDAAVRITNYSEYDASLEVSLYEADGAYSEADGIYGGINQDTENLLGIKQVTVEAGKSAVVLFEDVSWNLEVLKAEAGSIVFSGISEDSYNGDSLEKDNTAYAVRENTGEINAVLVGSNVFIENAYKAVTGVDITKTESDAVILGDTEYGLCIYDGIIPSEEAGIHRLVIGSETEDNDEGVLITARECEITAGLSEFTIGVNYVNYYEVPEWAESFLEYDGKCAGYYGEHDGIREVVIGFDLRESDFPLCAEYPVIFANIMSYLSDTSILVNNIYYAGEGISFNTSFETGYETYSADTKNSGIYKVYAGDESECFVVRFASSEESDGTVQGSSEFSGKADNTLEVRRNVRDILLVIAIILLIIEWIIYIRQNRYKGKFYLAVRIFLTVLILLAAVGIKIPAKSDRVVTVFVVDMSDSTSSYVDDINDYLRSTVKDMPKNNSYGIVTFGRNSEVEQFVTDEAFFSELMTSPDVNATNIETAVNKAVSMIPDDAAGRIVIITDGRETNGDIYNTANLISRSNIELSSILLDTPEINDAYVENVDIPAYLHEGDEYTLTVSVMSSYDTDAEIRIESGDTGIMYKNVTLKEGINQFAFSQTVTDDVMESFTVTVTAPGDECAVNDSYSVYSMVESTPKILVVTGVNENINAFIPVLDAAGADYDVVSALDAPSDLDSMLDYKSIVLADVYYDDLPEGFINNISAYVEDYAGGLICAGGENSFALGGYRDTVLEEILPVDMELRGENEIPEMAMVMVIDHSGSMLENAGSGGATNLDIAIQAASKAVDNLRADDYVGVLTFDDRYEWQVELVKAEDKEAIKDKIESVKEGGGTSIKPALAEACNELIKNNSAIKHIVLLTDGYGEDASEYEDVTQKINDSGITLSTVAVGVDSDRALLQMLAETCGGRYYYSDVSTDIPRIFAQEVYLSGDTYIQNGSFSLSVSSSSRITRGLFETGWPVLNGYIASSPKTNSSVLISSDKEDPILTVWQCGLGKTAAWNTDITGEWTGSFSGQDDYVQLWKRIIDYTAGSASINDDIAEVRNEAGHAVISYTAKDYTDETGVSAVYVNEEGEREEIELTCIAPGLFEAELDYENPGVYSINVRRSEAGDVTNNINTAYAVQYSSEYRFDIDSTGYESFVSQYGNNISFDDRVWTRLKSDSVRSYDITEILLILAILVLLSDIAVRRFYFVPKKIRLNILRKRAVSGESAQNEAGLSEVTEKSATEKVSTSEEKNSVKSKQKTAKKKKEKQAETLDTSALLKKKQDRE